MIVLVDKSDIERELDSLRDTVKRMLRRVHSHRRGHGAVSSLHCYAVIPLTRSGIESLKRGSGVEMEGE